MLIRYDFPIFSTDSVTYAAITTPLLCYVQTLSSVASTSIEIDTLYEGIDFYSSLTCM